MAGINPRVVSEWLAARAVIMAWLREMIPLHTPAWYERNAEALIARLALNEPPILLEFHREEEEPTNG